MVSSLRRRAPGGTLRLHAAFFALAVAALALCDVTRAQSRGDIVVAAVHGTATATMAGSTAPLAAGAILQLPATVRTGADGAIELRQGATTIAAAANTELEIPQSAANEGLIERVIQIRGNAFYNVAKREKTRLRVETPYLVAVIKGTQFNVASQENGTTIALFEGRLEVRATDESDVIDLDAGEIAIRNRSDVSIRVLRMTAVRRLQSQPGNASAGDAQASPSPGVDGIGVDGIGVDGIGAVASVPSSTNTDAAGGVTIESQPIASPDASRPGLADTTLTVGAGKAATAEITAGIDVGNAVATSTAVELDVGGASASVAAGATVDLTGGDIAANADVAVSAGTASVTANADVGLGGGTAMAAVDAGVDLGAIDASANTSAEVDLGSGGVSTAVDASAALPAVDTVASAGAAIDLGVASGANAALDIAAQGPGSTDAVLATDVGLDSGSAAVSIDSGVATGGSDVSIGLEAAAGPDTAVAVDTDIDTAVVDAGASVDVGAGDVSADVDVGGIVDVGVDLDSGTIDLDVGGGDTGGGLLNGLLNRRKD